MVTAWLVAGCVQLAACGGHADSEASRRAAASADPGANGALAVSSRAGAGGGTAAAGSQNPAAVATATPSTLAAATDAPTSVTTAPPMTPSVPRDAGSAAAGASSGTLQPTAPATPAPAPAPVIRQATPDEARARVLRHYQDELLPAFDVPLLWTGSVVGCVAGDTNEAYKQASLTVVNYYRQLAGVAPVTLDAGLSAKAQAAALMFAADRPVVHDPAPGRACYTADAAEAAAHGNLTWGTDAGVLTGPGAIHAYLLDTDKPGVGHRRWLLLPGLKRIGLGDTPHNNVMWVVDKEAPPVVPPADGVAWPPRGLVPWSARVARPSDRWSFELPGLNADLASATVAMTDGLGRPVPIVPTPLPDASLLAWQLAAPEADWAVVQGDAAFHVVIEQVRVDGLPRRFEYDVVFVRP